MIFIVAKRIKGEAQHLINVFKIVALNNKQVAKVLPRPVYNFTLFVVLSLLTGVCPNTGRNYL